MATGDPFLSAILAAPADDGPRLIWADWLAASDDPADRARGDLVRVQLALARTADHHPRRVELLVAQADLLHQYGERWAGPLDGLALGTEFRRGLLDTATVSARTFLARAQRLFAAAPLRRIRFTDAEPHLDRLADSPHLARLRSIDFCGNDLGTGGVRRLLASPRLTHLHTLDLTANRLDDAAAALIAAAKSLPNLRALGLADNPQITSLGATSLAESTTLTGLEKLDLAHGRVADAGARALAAPGRLPHLHALNLSGNPLGDAGLAALLDSPLLARLLTHRPALDLSRCALGPRGAGILAHADGLGRLAELDLTGNLLGDLGVMRLAESGGLPRLRRLALASNSVTDAGAVLLARSPLLAQLQRLDVSGNHLTQRGKAELARHRPAGLTVLAEG